MLSLLITLLVVLLVVGVVFYIISLLPIPAPWINIIRIIIALIVLIWLLETIIPLAGHPLITR